MAFWGIASISADIPAFQAIPSDALDAAIKKGIIDIKDINSSVDRIIKIKSKYKILDDYSKLGCDVVRINKEIDKINNMYDKGVVNEKEW